MAPGMLFVTRRPVAAGVTTKATTRTVPMARTATTTVAAVTA